MRHAASLDAIAAAIPGTRGAAGGKRLARRLLAEEMERGHVVVAGGGYRLSGAAEQLYGAALRDMGAGLQVGREVAA